MRSTKNFTEHLNYSLEALSFIGGMAGVDLGQGQRPPIGQIAQPTEKAGKR